MIKIEIIVKLEIIVTMQENIEEPHIQYEICIPTLFQ